MVPVVVGVCEGMTIINNLEFHDVASIFPLMSGDEYQALVTDIAEHGQIEPIWLHEGKIIDGRNRYRACCDLGIVPEYREWDGDGSLVAFVVSLNLKRRHLTGSQKATVGVEIKKQLQEETSQGMRSDLTSGNISRSYDPDDRTSRNLAGEIVGVSGRYIDEAERIQEAAPDLFAAVRSGDLTIPQAKQELKKQQAMARIEAVEQANTVLPIARRLYRVIYADPPWKYGNTMPNYFDEQAHHYTLMTVDDICQMPIDDLAMNDAVLFLWATSPILEEAFDVIRAWGFKYKASFVWDKIKHNMGHYNSVRHEFLLICVRGSCQPDVQTLFDSVQSVERTRHSEKPPIFREIIDTIYPHGPRIELFARQRADGWDVYGNEISG